MGAEWVREQKHEVDGWEQASDFATHSALIMEMSEHSVSLKTAAILTLLHPCTCGTTFLPHTTPHVQTC